MTGSLIDVFSAACREAGAGPPANGACAVTLLDAADWRPWLPQADALLDAAEAARVQRQRRPGEREVRRVAYAAHRLLLASSMGCAPRDVPLWRDALGCPRLAVAAWHTSLAHADGHIAIAVCADGAVGVDLEPAARATTMPELATVICHPDELAALAQLEAAALGKALLGVWVRKEALLKAAGVGLRRDMTGFAAPSGHPLPLCDGGQAGTVIHQPDAGPALCVAVAVPAGSTVTLARPRPR